MPLNSPWHGLPNETPPAGRRVPVWVVRGNEMAVAPAFYEEPIGNPPGRRWSGLDDVVVYGDVWGWRHREEGEETPPRPDNIRALNPWCPDGTDHNWIFEPIVENGKVVGSVPKCSKCGEVDDWHIDYGPDEHSN